MYGYVGFGWIWFLWMGVAFLMFSSIGYWSYACRAHHRFGGIPKGGFDLLDERYARAEIAADAYGRAKSGISSSRRRG